MSRYTNAFKKHDEIRFTEFKEKVKTGEVKINTSVLFPHDCVRTALNGDAEIADLQFDNLPNYFNGTNERIIVLADSSGSMSCKVSGSIEAIDISKGLALYCSDKIGKDNPFYRKFITFESESEFKNWNGMKFSEAVNSYELFDGVCGSGSTRIDKALNLILNTGNYFNLTKDQMPTALVIVSDMQFSDGATTEEDRNRFSLSYSISRFQKNTEKVTPVKQCLEAWTKNGYNVPKIIYWNTSGYAGAPDTANSENVALISGFAPAILTSIFSGEDLSPRAVLYKSLEKYEVNVP